MRTSTATPDITLSVSSHPKWVETVMNDFDSFLQDHADCERKASAMAMSFVAKYPDRKAMIPKLIATALEELRHFQQVHRILEKRGVSLTHELTEDPYVKQLVALARSGKEDRFLDRMLLAAIIETRGAERFRLVYEALEDEKLKDFYFKLYESEMNHGNIFLEMVENYFSKVEIQKRLKELVQAEGKILEGLKFRAALH